MPLYEYECEQCGATFEVIQKFSDHSVTACRTCGGSVRRLLSAPAIQFKGTGWYITDYARKGKGSSDSEKSEAANSSAGSTTSTDASPAPSTDTKSTSESSSTASPSASSSTTSSSDKK
jgi:putative FmdB family regulatory protein